MVTFIKPSEVIIRIKETILAAEANLDLPPGFVSYSERVAGSAYLEDITETGIQNLKTPSCFVTLTDGTATTNVIETVDQDIFHGFDIIVILDTQDRRKQTAEENIIPFKEILLYCLNGWEPVGYPCSSPLRFIGDTTVFSDKSKYVRVFTFIQDTRFIASQDSLGNQDEYDLQNFEKFLATLYATEQGEDGPAVGVQVIDMNDE
jgi:hypothetical protein